MNYRNTIFIGTIILAQKTTSRVLSAVPLLRKAHPPPQLGSEFHRLMYNCTELSPIFLALKYQYKPNLAPLPSWACLAALPF